MNNVIVQKLWKYKSKQDVFSSLYKINYLEEKLKREACRGCEELERVSHFRKVKKDGNQLIRIAYFEFFLKNIYVQNFSQLQIEGLQRILNTINIKAVSKSTIPKFYHEIYHQKFLIQKIVQGLHKFLSLKTWNQNQLPQVAFLNFINKHAIMDFLMIIFMRSYCFYLFHKKKGRFDQIEQQQQNQFLDFNRPVDPKLLVVISYALKQNIFYYQSQSNQLNKYSFHPNDAKNTFSILFYKDTFYILKQKIFNQSLEKIRIHEIQEDLILEQKQNREEQIEKLKQAESRQRLLKAKQKYERYSDQNFKLVQQMKQQRRRYKQQQKQKQLLVYKNQTLNYPLLNKKVCISCKTTMAIPQSYKGIFCRQCQQQFKYFLKQNNITNTQCFQKFPQFLKKQLKCNHCKKSILSQPIRSMRGYFCSNTCFQRQLQQEQALMLNFQKYTPKLNNYKNNFKHYQERLRNSHTQTRPVRHQKLPAVLERVYQNQYIKMNREKGIRKICRNCKMICFGPKNYPLCGKLCQIKQTEGRRHLQQNHSLPILKKK